MADIKVTGQIVPASSRSEYPTHEDTYAKGGWRSVASISARNRITQARRALGMAVYVRDTGETYTLIDGITNNDWVLHPGLSGGKSAYEIAKSYDSSIGTEEEWVKSLKGKTPKVKVGTVTVAEDDTPTITDTTTTSEGEDTVTLDFSLPRVTTPEVLNALNSIIEIVNSNEFLTTLYSGEINSKEITISGLKAEDTLLVICGGVTLTQVSDYTVEDNKITFQFDIENTTNLHVFKRATFSLSKFTVQVSKG